MLEAIASGRFVDDRQAIEGFSELMKAAEQRLAAWLASKYPKEV